MRFDIMPYLCHVTLLTAIQSEWVLLFRYIAAYPGIIREVTVLQKQGLGLYVTSGIKKVATMFITHL